MLRGFGAALAKDLRLLARDRVGLVFLTIAPIVVITVAGLSLANLYGVKAPGDIVSLLPVADEDGGWVGRALAEQLAREPAVELRAAPSRDAARDLVRRKRAAVALVIPAGTSAAIADGRPARLVLYTDPVRWIERGRIYVLVQEIRHGLEGAARDEAASSLEAAGARAAEARAAFAHAARNLEGGLARLRSRLADIQAEGQRRAAAGRRELAAQLARVAAERRAETAARLTAALGPLRDFLTDLTTSEQAFAASQFGVGSAILLESALSFLGFGAPEPTASWGLLMADGFQDALDPNARIVLDPAGAEELTRFKMPWLIG